MKLQLNGSLVDLSESASAGAFTISALLALHKIRPETVVVEHNRIVPPKSSYDSIKLRDGDQIEIVKFMGGG